MLRGLAVALLLALPAPLVAVIDGDSGQFTDDCADAMASSMQVVSDPSMRKTGELVMKCASLGAMLLGGPGGTVVGVGLLVAGGLCEAFGGPGEHEATVQDSIDFMAKNFKKVNLKLDELQSSVDQLNGAMEQVRADVGELYLDVHLGAAKLRKINGVYLEFMGRIFAASGNGSASADLAKDAKEYAEKQADKLSDLVFEVFVPSNIDSYLRRLLKDTERDGKYGDLGVVTLAYQQVMATRLKLFTIQLTTSIWITGGYNPLANKYVEDLREQVEGYQQIVEQLQLPINRSVAFLLHSHGTCEVANDLSARGLLPRESLDCCCGLRCRGGTCTCPKRLPKAGSVAAACGVVTTTTTTTTTKCLTDTGGTCSWLPCHPWRGATTCILGACKCNPGRCAVDGACSSSNCATYIKRSCRWWEPPCPQSPGVECRDGYCMCSDGFCARDGYCVPSGHTPDAMAALELPGAQLPALTRPAALAGLAALAALAAAFAALALTAARRSRQAGEALGREPLLAANGS
mmetsp:Transcript_61406/g.190343  ORF Transcript_61406/g.190343 Transcript_61406/m.190343 type:complete len:519 (+) Transcript_61406:48-1604(+)